MRAGVAKVEITPPVGVDLTGYVARLGPSTGVHDPLHARALVVEDGGTRVVLLVCDLVGLEAATVAAAREMVAAAVGTAPAAVMVACTHTHSGPATVFLHQCGEIDPAYLATLPGKLCAAAEAAASRLQPVHVAAGWGALPEGAFNRRGAGPDPDTSVGVVQLRGQDGAPVATLMTYGCHPVTMGADNLLISADYPAMAVAAVERATGAAALFLTGACGDVNPRRRGTFDETAWLGDLVAAEVVRVAAELETAGVGCLGYAGEALALPCLPVPGAGELAALTASYRGGLAAAEAAGEPVAIRIARAMLAWAESLAAKVAGGSVVAAGSVPPTARVEAQAIRLGPAVFAGVSGELFSSLGARVKAAGANREVYIVGYANGDVGYIPDEIAYATGGYEVSEAYKYYDAAAALAPEAGEMLVAAAQRLVHSV